MQRSLRHKTIIQALASGAELSVEALTELTGASAPTLRRDLTLLQEQGLVQRTHGGARRAVSRGLPMPYAVRQSEDAALKAALGQAAATLIEPGESVILDNGTTTLAVARALAGKDITALALSLHTAAALAEVPGVRALVPAGAIEPGTLNITGPALLGYIADFCADTFIMGACALDLEQGLTASTYEDAQVKRACLTAASRSVMVAGPQKFGRTATFRVGPLDVLDTVVTGAESPAAELDYLTRAGTQVVRAGT